VLLAIALFGFTGCGPARLDVSKTETLDPGEAKSIICDPQSKPQTLTVEFESSASEIIAFVINESEVKDDNLILVDSSKAIAKAEGKTGKFTAEVPANTGVHVIIRGAKVKSEVKLHVTNKK
jgi:hypothetical protein